MQVKFKALLKEIKVKSLVSGDKGYTATFQGEDHNMKMLAECPSDDWVEVEVTHRNYDE